MPGTATAEPTDHPASGRAPRHSAWPFIRQFVSRPFEIGAVAPSSPALARAMVEGLDLGHATAVVEFGPGTGAFTDAILPRLNPAAAYFAIDINPAMARLWRARHPGRTLHEDSVANVARLCRQAGCGPVDYILSGLPWASFPDHLQADTLRGAVEVLKPGGLLVTFGYHIGTLLPAGKRFYRRLPEYFSRVDRSPYVWANMPPAFVVRCTK